MRKKCVTSHMSLPPHHKLSHFLRPLPLEHDILYGRPLCRTPPWQITYSEASQSIPTDKERSSDGRYCSSRLLLTFVATNIIIAIFVLAMLLLLSHYLPFQCNCNL